MTTEAPKLTVVDWLARLAVVQPGKGLHALDGYTQLKTTWFDLSGR